MLLDALAWNMLNVIRVELALNCYKLYDVFLHSSFKSPRGQYAIASFVITLLTMLTIQFNFSWLLTIYTIYLSVGTFTWLYRRVYFYHRKLDPMGVNQTINQFDANRQQAVVNNGDHTTTTTSTGNGMDKYLTLSGKSHKSSHQNGHTNSSNSNSSAASSSASSTSGDTNSLQRQRVSAYRDFRSLLTEPRQTHKEFALSLVHLSNLSQLFVGKDVFDEMHFQILATRRDVLNILLRATLILGATTLAYMR